MRQDCLTLTVTFDDVATIPRLDHAEAMWLAHTEFARVLQLIRDLQPGDWRKPTVCELWDVRALVAHVVGMAEAQASVRQFIHDFRAASKRTGGAMIDAMTATQVTERAHLAPAQLIERMAVAAPRAVAARTRTAGLVRSAIRMRQDPPLDTERWPYGFLVDTLFTRNAWMYRLDIARATGRDMVLAGRTQGSGLLRTPVPF